MCPTAIVCIKNHANEYIQVRALLDTGASVSVISDSLVSQLKLHRQSNPCNIIGLGNQSVNQPRQTTKIIIRPVGKSVPIISTIAIIMYSLTADIPSTYIQMKKVLKDNNIQLSDDSCGIPQPIDLILGTDILNYVYDGSKHFLTSGLAAYGTCFGHVVMGPISSEQTSSVNQISSEAHATSVQYYRIHMTKLEELSTIFSKIEAILNSRPLVPMSEDPCDLEVLTPGHFLIGQPIVALPEPHWKDTKFSRLSRFQTIQKMYQNIWSRWHSEYLTSLQVRNKWFTHSANLKIDDLVLIIDENSTPLHWKRGRIIELYSGRDSVIRSVKLKTQNGELVRPVIKLCKLPMSDNDNDVSV